MKSYTMELWYHRDNFLPTINIETNPAALKKNYIFYSNTIRLYWNYTNPLAKVYVIEYNYGINTVINVVGTVSIVNNSWNKLIFSVIYTSTNPPTNSLYTYAFEFYTNNVIQGTAKMTVGSVPQPSDQSLKYIVWTHLDPDTNMSEISGIYWHSGIYRNLRIWDGDVFNPWVLTQYDL
jgi:hypothetical protein